MGHKKCSVDTCHILSTKERILSFLSFFLFWVYGRFFQNGVKLGDHRTFYPNRFTKLPIIYSVDERIPFSKGLSGRTTSLRLPTVLLGDLLGDDLGDLDDAQSHVSSGRC